MTPRTLTLSALATLAVLSSCSTKTTPVATTVKPGAAGTAAPFAPYDPPAVASTNAGRHALPPRNPNVTGYRCPRNAAAAAPAANNPPETAVPPNSAAADGARATGVRPFTKSSANHRRPDFFPQHPPRVLGPDVPAPRGEQIHAAEPAGEIPYRDRPAQVRRQPG